MDYSDRTGMIKISSFWDARVAGPKELFLLGRVHFLRHCHEAKFRFET